MMKTVQKLRASGRRAHNELLYAFLLPDCCLFCIVFLANPLMTLEGCGFNDLTFLYFGLSFYDSYTIIIIQHHLHGTMIVHRVTGHPYYDNRLSLMQTSMQACNKALMLLRKLKDTAINWSAHSSFLKI